MYMDESRMAAEPEIGEGTEGEITFNPSDKAGLENLGEQLRVRYGLTNAPVLYYSRKPWWIRWARWSQAS